VKRIIIEKMVELIDKVKDVILDRIIMGINRWILELVEDR
jgi:hypothetical protein